MDNIDDDNMYVDFFKSLYVPEGSTVTFAGEECVPAPDTFITIKKGVVCEGFSREAPVTIKSPWWRLLKDDGKVTTLDITFREGNHCTIDLHNDSEGLKSILESDPYGENPLSIGTKQED
jgi:hypothetical protein